MNRSLTCVRQLWNEYCIGDHHTDPVKPSIMEMDKRAKFTKINWKKANVDAKFYSKRAPIWLEIIKRCDKGENVNIVKL
jgi:hypothetical protein